MNPLPYTISRRLGALVAGNRGRLVAAATGLGAWLVSQAVTRWGLDMPQETATSVSALVGALAGWAIDHVGARLNSAGIRQIQETLPGVVPDGAALPMGQTVSAVSVLAGAVEDVAPVTTAELAKLKDRLPAVLDADPALLHAVRQAVISAARGTRAP